MCSARAIPTGAWVNLALTRPPSIGGMVKCMIGQKLIDLELTQQLLDHLGVVVVQNESVTEAAESRRGFTFGVNVPWAASGGGESGKSNQAERQFEIPSARPTKLTTLALDGCRRDGSLIDLDQDPSRAVSARSPIVFTAAWSLQAAQRSASCWPQC